MLGRLLGTLLNQAGVAVDPGLYSLMVAAAVLGGVTRLPLPLAVLLVAVTNHAMPLLPMLFALARPSALGAPLPPSFLPPLLLP